MSDAITKKPLTWDEDGERLYETGVEKGVLYVKNQSTYGNGVAWNGLSKVSENPSGAEPTALYANNKKYVELMSNEEFAATIEAYTYPDEFAQCDGSQELVPGVRIAQQDRKQFGLSYKTLIGNDSEGVSHGYKIHLVYGCLAKPSSKENSTTNDSPEAATMSWEASTTPVPVKYNGKDYKPTAHLTIDSTKTDKSKLAKLEEALYGHYEALAEAPDDYTTNKGSYFIKNEDGSYSAATGEFQANQTYKFVDAYLPLPSAVAAMIATV